MWVWVKVSVSLLWCVERGAAKLGAPREARKRHLETLGHINSLEAGGVFALVSRAELAALKETLMSVLRQKQGLIQPSRLFSPVPWYLHQVPVGKMGVVVMTQPLTDYFRVK